MGTPNSPARSIEKIQRDLATDPETKLSYADAHAVGLYREIMLATYETDVAPYVPYLDLCPLYEHSGYYTQLAQIRDFDTNQQVVKSFYANFLCPSYSDMVTLFLTRKRRWIVVTANSARDRHTAVADTYKTLGEAYQQILDRSLPEKMKLVAPKITAELRRAVEQSVIVQEHRIKQMRGALDAAARRHRNVHQLLQ